MFKKKSPPQQNETGNLGCGGSHFPNCQFLFKKILFQSLFDCFAMFTIAGHLSCSNALAYDYSTAGRVF